MKTTYTSRYIFIQIIVFAMIVAMTTSSVLPRGSNLSNARAEAGVVQIQPVVVYPEAFAVSLPASETLFELIKNGERKPITPPGVGAGEQADTKVT